MRVSFVHARRQFKYIQVSAAMTKLLPKSARVNGDARAECSFTWQVEEPPLMLKSARGTQQVCECMC